MNARQYAAGWRAIDDPAAGPDPCIGSGQLVLAMTPANERAFASVFSAAWDTCPECGRRVQIVTRDGAGVLARHDAPETDIPRGRPADGPTLGL